VITLQPDADGVVLAVKARAGARQNAVRGEHEGALKVAVTQVPEKGKANRAIVKLLAKTLGLRRSQLELLDGETNSHKRFLIREADIPKLEARLRQLAEGP
jgi:uncharacterized protein (TIGR00251 family)